jgi:protein TonB
MFADDTRLSPIVKREPLRARLLMVAGVALVHVLLLWFWMAVPKATIPVPHEMSVSMMPVPVQVVPRAVPQAAPRVAAQAAPKTAPPLVNSDEPRLTAPAVPVAAKPATEVAAPQQISAQHAQPDAEPDYKAGYLNNPRPAYPMVARRMGWQGRVILNVEVLASGASGTVVVFHGSGHEVLDNAAMNTVKGWRFTPARHAGRAVTQWFKVPIVFSLEDNEV